MTTQDSHPTTDAPADSASEEMSPTESEPASGSDAPGEPVSASSESVSTSDEPDRTTTAEDELVSQEAVMDFKARWEAIQQGFVDDPRSAVSDADSLVSDVLQKLSTSFEEQHGRLESQWSDGEPDTEELRSAFQRYREFFDRLLAI